MELSVTAYGLSVVKVIMAKILAFKPAQIYNRVYV